MAIQNRGGDYADFDPNKMVPREIAFIRSGDPNSVDGKSVYVCFEVGNVKRFATYEDMVENINNATEEIQEQFTEVLRQATEAAEAAAVEANAATDIIKEIADDLDEKINTDYYRGAQGLQGIQGPQGEKGDPGDTIPTANNLTTTVAGFALDARMGKYLNDKMSVIGTRTVALNTEQLISNTNTWTDITSLTLAPGTYVINGAAGLFFPIPSKISIRLSHDSDYTVVNTEYATDYFLGGLNTISIWTFTVTTTVYLQGYSNVELYMKGRIIAVRII